MFKPPADLPQGLLHQIRINKTQMNYEID